MTRQTRREFFKNTAIAGGSVTLGGLAFGEETAQPSGAPDMTIARWKGHEAPIGEIATKLTEQAIEALGGMKRFVSSGDVVWLKANIAWDRTPELAANTNPDVMKTLTRLCLDAGAKTVKVGDNPCHPAERSYPASGIADAVREAGAEVVMLDRNRVREMDIAGQRLKSHPVFPEIIECDLVISIPVTKHHSATRITNCMKNYMGVVEDRGTFHQDLPTCITDITAFMKPRLSVMDAVRILTANGPTGGNLEDVRQPNIVAAGTDLVALDAFGAEVLGNDPKDIGTVVAGQERGLGTMDYRSLALRELEVT